MKPAIRVENLSKKYRVVHAPKGGANATEMFSRAAKELWRKVKTLSDPTAMEDENTFWALKDVSFEVQPGEVVGIIGRNGAGKSTLLKILSRIVEPTGGRAEFRGRMGSLLEVGTGFHPELTGRENVYLNGAVLGMTRKEIAAKFDEIVEFSGVEQFLDTPVKRYSSGMYVRLAFAVAAHLEPEILIVDEVLAVGDADFQNKCFQKMEEIRRSGRTVIVVSHNLGSILSLCTHVMNFEMGRLVRSGRAKDEVSWYLSRLTESSRLTLRERRDREGGERARVVHFGFINSTGCEVGQAICGEELQCVIDCELTDPRTSIDYVAVSCWTTDGTKVFHVDNTMRSYVLAQNGTCQQYKCIFPKLPLSSGVYKWNIALMANGMILDHVYSAASLDVLAGDFFRTGRSINVEDSLILVDHSWH